MNLILASVMFFFILLVGLIPFFLLFPLSDFVRFVLNHVAGYRKKVIRQNLTLTFPGLNEKELKQLIRSAYKNLSDVLLEGFKGFTMTKGQVRRRHKVLNPEIIAPYRAAGKSIVAVPSHYGNWEWGALSAALYLEGYHVIAFYKPLNNPFADKFMRGNRSRTGTMLASIYITTATFAEFGNRKSFFIMAADQSPSTPKKAIWLNFLGRRTAFLHGPEKHATQYNCPVVFVDIQRIKRGYYTLELSVLAENPSELEPGEITKRYAGKLEEVIRKNPGNWLWSHRRWKLN